VAPTKGDEVNQRETGGREKEEAVFQILFSFG
jgi:hypothetical protein